MKRSTPSATARLIAAATVLLAVDADDTHMVAPGAAELCAGFLSTGLADRLLLRSVRHRLSRRFWRLIESATLPGIVRHYWLRKRWLERVCRAALAEGYRQVIILGAGLDTLALRLAAEMATSGSQVRWIELDHPATQAIKLAALARPGAGCEKRVGADKGIRFVPHNFVTDDLIRNLTSPKGAASPSFMTDVDTFVVAEGVLMYLAPAAIATLLQSLAALRCSRLKFAFTYMEKNPDDPTGPAGFRPRSRLTEM